MMKRFFGARGSRATTIDALVRHVAETSVHAVECSVAEALSGMGPFEARGYIRARAGVVVRRHARATTAGQPGLAERWETIAARASDRVAPLVLRKLAEQSRAPGAAHRAA